MIYVLILTVLESLGTVSYYNLNALQHQVRANAMFFIRSGFWVLAVVALCTLSPALRFRNCAELVQYLRSLKRRPSQP